MYVQERPLARFYKQNRPQQLRGFYHVAITGSFTAAAERMGLGQSAVSLQIQALERELKARLFERRRGSVTLTQEGQTLFEVASPIVQALETVDEAFRERLGQIEVGRVSCAATDSIILEVLPYLVERFTARFPSIEVDLYSGTSLQAVDMVARGETDLGIGTVNRPHQYIKFQPLEHSDYYVVVPPDHPLVARDSVSLACAAEYPLVAPVHETDLWQTMHEALVKRDLKPRVVLRVASTLARLRYVEAGLGITITSLIGAPSELADRLAWIPVADELPRSRVGLITRSNSFLSLPARRFAEFVVESLSSSRARGRGPAPPTG